VHPQAAAQRLVEERLRPDRDLGVGLGGARRLGAGHGPEDQEGRGDGRLAQLLGFGDGRHTQPRGAGAQRRPGDRHGAVTVAVGLDHRAQRRAGRQQCDEVGDVVAHGRQVDRRQGALSVVEHAKVPACG
jgi:hypothetical protein